MIHTRFFILLFFLWSGSILNAQSPGYMGKKVSIGYGLNAHPAFNSILFDYSDSPINTLHEFFAEYAVRKKLSLGFSVQLYSYTYNNIEKAQIITNNNSYWPYTTVTPEGSYQIKGRNYKFYGKLYLGKYLAPWGKYLLMGLVLNQYTTSYDRATMYAFTDAYTNNGTKYKAIYNNWGTTTNTYATVDLLFGIGSSRVLGDKIILDYGLSGGAISMLKTLYTFDDSFLSLYEGIPAASYISKTSEARVAAINRFNFYLKIGYLF